MLLPALLFAGAFFVLPLTGAVFLSLTDAGFAGRESAFVGLANYASLLAGVSGEAFRLSLLRTALYALLKAALTFIPALFISELIDRQLPFGRLCLTACAAPLLISASVTGLIFLWLYDPNIGPLSALLTALGLPGSRFLYGEGSALLCVILFSVWRSLGLEVLIFTAALKLIPRPFEEAARLDGCTPAALFARIKLPLIKPYIIFALAIDLIDSLRTFTDTHILTPDGGPAGSTTLAANAVYTLAFKEGRFGAASAAALLLLVIALALAALRRLVVSGKRREVSCP